MFAAWYKHYLRDYILFIKYLDLKNITIFLVYISMIRVVKKYKNKKKTLRRCLIKTLKIKEFGRPKDI